LRICDIKVFQNANVYSIGKVIKMSVDLENWADIATNEISGFNETLINLLPGIKDHCCSSDRPGGFLERLNAGTYPAHVIEHVCIEILNMLGYDVSFGIARRVGESNCYNIVYSYFDEAAGIEAGKAAVRLVGALFIGEQLDDVTKLLAEIRAKTDSVALGPSTRAIVEEAIKRGIPVNRIGYESIVQLGYGEFQKRIEATISDTTSCVSVDIAGDKSLTKQILKEIGIPVPAGNVCTKPQDALEISKMLGYPVVIKPERGNQGKGVSVAMMTPEEVVYAFEIASNIDRNVIIEKHVKGKDYRVLVVDKKVVAVARRIPAYVVGNGKNTLVELIDIVNQDVRRGYDHEKPLTRIKVDDITLGLLKRRGLDLSTVVPSGIRLNLKYCANLSTGGEAIDCTEKIHPINACMAVRAAMSIGLDIAGVDIVCPDISIPIEEGRGVVVEVNAAPGIRMHLYPSNGKSRNVAKDILDMLYPKDSKHSIPIVSITGTNGKTTTTRMIAHIFRQTGITIGMATTGGIYVNDECILKGDTTGPESAKMILNDKRVGMAVLETARGGIIRSGLGYVSSDVGVITNISNDHLGIDGVYTLNDMLHVKSVVVEAVKKNGHAVLNADDLIVVSTAERVKCNIVYFSRQENNLIIRNHIAAGGKAVFIKEGHIIFSSNDSLTQSIHINQIPSVLKGDLPHNIENALASASCAFALNLKIKDIEKGLESFYINEHQNPGRFNVFDVGDFKVIVDYAHNVASYKSMADALRKIPCSKLVGIIGLPGDRNDEIVREVGFIAGQVFDEIVIKEDIDLRGRQRGEIAQLLEQGVMSAGFSERKLRIILNELDALKSCMTKAQPRDVIVIFYERFDPILDLIKQESSRVEQVFRSKAYPEFESFLEQTDEASD